MRYAAVRQATAAMAPPMPRMHRTLLSALLLLALAACAPQRSESGRFLVYFEPWSALLSLDAQKVVAEAAKRARDTKVRLIRIEAYGSAVGSIAANKFIAETRSQVIADWLQKNGIDPAILQQVPIGQTASGDASVAERRAEIVLMQ
jgi:outer membrane protein OmpA-like peptidoglycan-associated protein